MNWFEAFAEATLMARKRATMLSITHHVRAQYSGSEARTGKRLEKYRLERKHRNRAVRKARRIRRLYQQ